MATLGAVEGVLIEKLAAAAVRDWGETEFQEIAAAAGIPLDAVRESVRNIQRGAPSPSAPRAEEQD